MAYRRCDDCGQVYDLNAEYDHECPEPVVMVTNPAGTQKGKVFGMFPMDAEERWYALNDGWVT